MGNALSLPLHTCDASTIASLADSGFEVVAATLSPAAIPLGRHIPKRPLALIVGNEGFGIPAKIAAQCGTEVVHTDGGRRRFAQRCRRRGNLHVRIIREKPAYASVTMTAMSLSGTLPVASTLCEAPFVVTTTSPGFTATSVPLSSTIPVPSRTM